MAENRK